MNPNGFNEVLWVFEHLTDLMHPFNALSTNSTIESCDFSSQSVYLYRIHSFHFPNRTSLMSVVFCDSNCVIRKALNHMVVKKIKSVLCEPFMLSILTRHFPPFTNVSLFLLPYGRIYFVKRLP